MHQRLSRSATTAAVSVLLLALFAAISSVPVDAAPSGISVETTGSNPRRLGSAELSVDSPQSKLEEQLMLLRSGNLEPDSSASSRDDEEYGREDEIASNSEVKRKWGQNNLALWGKRRLPYSDEDDSSLSAAKRKWGQKNMALWGKRSEHNSEDFAAEKRKWGQKNMALWGRK